MRIDKNKLNYQNCLYFFFRANHIHIIYDKGIIRVDIFFRFKFKKKKVN